MCEYIYMCVSAECPVHAGHSGVGCPASSGGCPVAGQHPVHGYGRPGAGADRKQWLVSCCESWNSSVCMHTYWLGMRHHSAIVAVI